MLWTASFRHLLRHPAQLALALAGLALGVGTIAAVDIATGSAERAFALSMDAVNGAATHQLVGGPGGLDETLYVSLQTRASEIAFAPVVEGYAVVAERTMQIIGIDPLADPGFRESGGAAEGIGDSPLLQVQRWFTEPGTVMMAERTATQLGISAGSDFTLRMGGREYTAKLLDHIGAEPGGYDTVILTDIAQAQEWLGRIGRLSRIDVRIASGPGNESALADLRARVPPGVEIRETQRSTQQSLDMTRAFTTNLQAMSLLALLVSAFLIYSAISFAVVQRRRTLSVLRALGATRGAVLAIVLIEAVVIGLIGAGLGLLAGIAIGRELIGLVSGTINDLYFVVAVNETTLPASSIAKALLCGLSVALVAAALPAAEAANSAPQLGIRRSVLEEKAIYISRWLLIASVALAISSAVVVWLSGRSLFAGFVALFLLLLSVAALTPATLRALARVAARVSGRFSPVARLAFGDIGASLSRTGVAVAALGLAVSAMLGVSIMVESFRQSLHEWLVQTLRADIYVSAPGPGFARPERQLDPKVTQALLRTEGVVNHTEARSVEVGSPHGPIPLDAFRLNEQSYSGFQLTEGDQDQLPNALESGEVIISEPLAWRLQLQAGGTITLNTAEGERGFRIAGIYREYGNDRGNVVMDRNVYRRHWKDDAITGLGLYLAEDVKSESVIEALRTAAAGRQALFIRSNADIRELSMSIFERTFVITRVLYWLAAAVAAIGLVSALLAWELERSRELAILRSLGLTPRATAVLIETQTGFMGLVALLAAIPAGVLTGILLIEVINRRAFGWEIDLHLTPAQFTNALLLAMTAALVAGVYPAWRSGRAPIASDIREE